MNMEVSEQNLYTKIEKLVKKIDLLERKKKQWGLSREEYNKLYRYNIEFLQNHYQLIDITFNNYIEPFLYNDRIIEIKSELFETYKWDGKLLCFDEDINNFIKNVKDNKNDVIKLLNELKDEEIKSSIEFLLTEQGQEMEELFCKLKNTSEKNSIKEYIDIRYDIMMEMIEVNENE